MELTFRVIIWRRFAKWKCQLYDEKGETRVGFFTLYIFDAYYSSTYSKDFRNEITRVHTEHIVFSISIIEVVPDARDFTILQKLILWHTTRRLYSIHESKLYSD